RRSYFFSITASTICRVKPPLLAQIQEERGTNHCGRSGHSGKGLFFLWTPLQNSVRTGISERNVCSVITMKQHGC
ncbi:hypothetical protein WG66_005144, partial [Moniliophthora roreri]